MLRLYDTRTRQVETIEPVRRGRLSVYSCGPTVYRPAHVGNLRSYLLADLIRRTAGRHRLLVTSCQNITDVGHLVDDTEIDPEGEDKVAVQAQAEGKSPLDLARFYEEAFHADCAALNIHPADSYPRASESIDMMIDLIARLIETGHAYAVPGGSVYFDARSFPSYGELSGNRLGDLRPSPDQQGTDPDKRFHADWALWKAARSGRELTYAAPWGTGFPGWHTECSAMSLHYLGETIDVHTGGIDLRFPHHEDDRAQSNSVTGHEVVRHWVHGEHLLFEGRKMAKSTGNVVLLADLTARGLDPLALRFAFLDHRYRQQLNLTWAVLEAADRTLRRWRERVAEWAARRASRCARSTSATSPRPSTTTWTPRRRCGSCGAWRRTVRSRPGPSSRRSPTLTTCSAWTWPGTSDGSPRHALSPTTRRTCWRSGRPLAPRPTGPWRTGSATSSGRSALR